MGMRKKVNNVNMRSVMLNPMLLRAATYLFIAGAAARIVLVALLSPHYVDFHCFVDAADAVYRGEDPFQRENLTRTKWEIAPLVYPGLTPFFMPFVPMGSETGEVVFLILNVIAGLTYYGLVVRASGLCSRFCLRAPDVQTLLVCLGVFLYVNSIFFTLCIRVGQISFWAALCFGLSLTAATVWSRGTFFGLAAVFKYSNIPILALLLLSRKQIWVCATGFVVFLVVSLIPCLFGISAIQLYTSYLQVLRAWMEPGGGNSFAHSGQTILSLDFLRVDWIRYCVAVALVAAFVLAVRRARLQVMNSMNVYLLFALVCLVLHLVYHRIYDGVLMYPVLLVACVRLIHQRKRSLAVVAAGFICAFALPGAVWEAVARRLGGIIGENAIVYLPQDTFPLAAVTMFLLTVFALYVSIAVGGESTVPKNSRLD